MYKNKYLKPNLVDPFIEEKIIKTLKPQPMEDYWAPTKNSIHSFYIDYIIPNIYIIIFIIIILILLVYRYRTIKNEREEKLIVMQYKYPKQNKPVAENTREVQEKVDLLIKLYNEQKENSREPRIKDINPRMEPANIKSPKLAYPMYPYTKGGVLTPSSYR